MSRLQGQAGAKGKGAGVANATLPCPAGTAAGKRLHALCAGRCGSWNWLLQNVAQL
jgi:hypothetical protein